MLLDVFAQPTSQGCRYVDNGDKKKCKEPLDRVDGYLSDLECFEGIAAKSELRVSAAMDRSTGTAAREMLFTQHTLTSKKVKQEEEEICFRGTLRLADSALKDKLEHFLRDGTSLFLGSGRSRGLGEVVVEAFKMVNASISLEERWEQFNEVAAQRGWRREPSILLINLFKPRCPAR